MAENNSNEALKALEVQYNQVINSKFILSNQPIKNLLKCLAYYEDFVSLIDKNSKNFDYEKELNKCITNTSRNKSFDLPNSDNKIISLVTCLLLDFDEGDRNITEFIITYFPALSHNQSYKLFCEKVLAPYYNAIVVGVQVSQGKSIKDELLETDNKISLVSEGFMEQVQYLIQKAFEQVKITGLSEKNFAECKTVIECFLLSAESCDRRRIKGSWIGMKNTLKVVKNIQPVLKKIEDLLEHYLIL